MNAFKFGAVLALLISAEVGRADPLDTWSERQSGTRYGLSSIAYGNGQFVAVGEDDDYEPASTFLTSADGINWLQRQAIRAHRLSSFQRRLWQRPLWRRNSPRVLGAAG